MQRYVKIFNDESNMTKAIWISYDLGIGGDYDGLYRWLANHKAVECGDGLAFFNYVPKNNEYLFPTEKAGDGVGIPAGAVGEGEAGEEAGIFPEMTGLDPEAAPFSF